MPERKTRTKRNNLLTSTTAEIIPFCKENTSGSSRSLFAVEQFVVKTARDWPRFRRRSFQSRLANEVPELPRVLVEQPCRRD